VEPMAQTTQAVRARHWSPERPHAPPGGTLEVLTSPVAFAALAREWNALVDRTSRQFFYRHEFLSLWLQSFAGGGSLRVLTLRDAGGRLTAALPLLLRQARLHGVPMRELCAPANVHSCRFDLVADDPSQAAEAFLSALRNQADWDVLRLIDVPQGGAGEALVDAARQCGLPCGQWPSLESPFITLPSGWGAMEGKISTKFRANLRRRRKRLKEHGDVSVERIGNGPAMMAQLDEGLMLESGGWKGARGTAICQEPATLGFYTTLARQCAAEDRLALWFLRLDGRVVAFQFGLQHQGRYLLLKPAYDEALAGCSPGQLLMEDVVRDCIAHGLDEFDFLGPDMPWKRDWTTSTRRHNWLYVFRGPRGRLLHSLKFRIGPMARAMAKRWKA
jgi:CelD/BcsL family acetyltransferase involved in cellulose biosynthesis